MMFLTVKKWMSVIAVSVVLFGCASNPLDAMVTEAIASQNQLASLDDAEEEEVPLQTSMLDVFASSIPELSNAEKIALILDIRSELVLIQMEVNELRTQAQTLIPTFRERVAAFKSSGLTLNEEEQARLTEQRQTLRSARLELQSTRGMVQAQLIELRGQYTLANIDMILDTYLEVQTSMNTRVNSIQTIVTILTEVDALLQTKLA